MRLDCTYTWHGDIASCPITETHHLEDISERRLPPPVPPRGWRQVHALLFCPRRTLLLTIDGEPQSLTPEEV
jgi:hypothetical protein